MTDAEIVKLLLDAIPDETLQTGQRLRLKQVALLNRAVFEAKYNRKPE